MSHEPTHLDLFSGIGGFALAAGWAGFRTVAFSEIDPYASAVLRKHWPDVPNLGDVRQVAAWPDLGNVSLLTGGFPCQPHSLAGKRRGSADDRHLWPAMRDVIAALGPAWVCAENVPGIIGMELDRVLSDLEGIQYRVWTVVVPACATDARHRRDRVWIVAHASCLRWGKGRSKSDATRQAISGGDGDVSNTLGAGLEKRRQQPAREECTATERGGGTLADATGWQPRQPEAGNGRESAGRDGEAVPNARCLHGAARGGSASGQAPEWGAQSQSGGCLWRSEAESGVCRVSDGVPNRVDRLRCLGNAIVPQVAYQILKAIREQIA